MIFVYYLKENVLKLMEENWKKQYYKKYLYPNLRKFSPLHVDDENANFNYDGDINKNSKINSGNRTILPSQTN